MMRLKPSFCASAMRCSMRLTERISPANPTSPQRQVAASRAISILLLRTAARTARSIAVSSTRRPPAILRKTSFCSSLNPTRFSKTARSMFRRLPSKPVEERWGVPYAAEETRACTSIMNGRTPSTAAAIAMPERPSRAVERSSSEGLVTSRKPSCRIS